MINPEPNSNLSKYTEKLLKQAMLTTGLNKNGLFNLNQVINECFEDDENEFGSYSVQELIVNNLKQRNMFSVAHSFSQLEDELSFCLDMFDFKSVHAIVNQMEQLKNKLDRNHIARENYDCFFVDCEYELLTWQDMVDIKL